MVGNAKLVAGQVMQLKGYGKLSGKYLLKNSRHALSKSSGYTLDIEVKMVEYIDDEVKVSTAGAAQDTGANNASA